jgi:hypothetical protein
MMGAVRTITLLAIGLLLMLVILPVRAPETTTITAIPGTTPTLDGTVDHVEWGDANSVNFSVTDGYNCTAYVKQNGSHLHIACDIPDPTIETPLGYDRIWIHLDVEHNNGTDPQTDDIGLRIDRDGTIKELNGTGSGFQYTVVTNWTGGASSTLAGWQVEVSISYSKIGVIACQAKTLGIHLDTYDHNGSTAIRGEWPSGSSSQIPSSWGDLTSPAPFLWVPEPTVFVGITLMFAAMLMYVYLRKRR